MSNPSTPFGLRPAQHLTGSPWNGMTLRCYIPVGDSAGAYFVGYPVILAGSASADCSSPTVSIASAGTTNPIFGVITSFEPVDPTGGNVSGNLNLQITYRPNSTAMYCLVCCDPTVLYEVKSSSATVLANTDVGSNFQLAAGGGGDTTTGFCSWSVLATGSTTSSAAQVKLIRATGDPDNDITSAYSRWYVLINLNQIFSGGVTAVGTAIAGAVGV